MRGSSPHKGFLTSVNNEPEEENKYCIVSNKYSRHENQNHKNKECRGEDNLGAEKITILKLLVE